MRDEVGPNPLTAFGTASLVTGALTYDTDQALSFPGTSAYYSAADSVSLSDTGSLSIEAFVRIPSAPGSAVNLIHKSGSYTLALGTDRKLTFTVVGGGTTSVVSNTVLAVDTWYHVVCVLNQEYAGTPQFGVTSVDATGVGMSGSTNKFGAGTASQNLQVSARTVVEAGLVSQISMPIARDDEIWTTDLRMVIYSDSGGVPGVLLVQTDSIVLPSIAARPPTYIWVTLPGSGIVLPGTVWVGYQMGRTDGQAWTTYASSGSTRKINASFGSGAPSSFGSGTLVSSQTLTNYVDYSPIGRTGLEGKALLYINGALDNSANHTTGVADTANALEIGKFGRIDDVSFWSRALKPYEIGTHYTAH